jgi:protein-disulfide isomerase
MKECGFCDEEFEGEEALQIHWMKEHEDELNSHQKEKAKKAKREKEEREKIRQEHRKKRMYQGIGALVVIGIGALLGPQILSTVMPSGPTDINVQDEPMIGDENASVTVVEFGDFQCPACNQFEQSAYSQLKSEYIDTGQVKFYWKDYPLEQLHPWARNAAETMECVYRQEEEAFWKVKSNLFANQASLNQGNVQERIIGWASDEGVNESEVNACLNNGNPREEVNGDIREGQGNGVTGTPTIYVNGEKLDSFDYATVSQAIDEELEE